MTSLTKPISDQATLSNPVINPNDPAIIRKSPRITSERSPRGIEEGDSTISSAHTNNDLLLRNSKERVKLNSKELPSIDVSSLNKPTISDSVSRSKNFPEPDYEPPRISSSSDMTIPMMISTIFQRFLVRMPHTFIAMAGLYFPLYYGLGNESLAISATTFVGVGGTVYCFVRAFFLEVIPEWMLARTDATKKWRVLMNITYTGFITVMFTSAVWKLPDLSAVQGLAFLTLSFGAPYRLLATLYPDIDKQPTMFQRKYGII
jgi:hypothetical protein